MNGRQVAVSVLVAYVLGSVLAMVALVLTLDVDLSGVDWLAAFSRTGIVL